jgi:hypothetical protein
LAPLSVLADDNLDFLVQRIEEAKQPVRRESLQSAPEKGGNPRLVCAQDTCGLLLGELALLDEFSDTIGNLRFDVEFLSVRQLQILEDVLPALTYDSQSFHRDSCSVFSFTCVSIAGSRRGELHPDKPVPRYFQWVSSTVG